MRPFFSPRNSLACLVLICLAAPLAAAPDLRSVETRHYRIHTDLEQELTEDIATRMDAMYEEYSRRLADFKRENGMPRLEVYLFAKQADYMQFTGDRLRNTGGVYIPRRNLLAAFLEGQGRDGLRRTLQHEAFHQFAYNAISPNLPVWLNEGMAQVFEEAIWTGNGFWLGQVPPRRLRQLQQDLKEKRIVDFDAFLRLAPEQWAANLTGDHDLGATQYNQSWAMVYFLTYAKDENNQEKYRKRLLTMLRLLHEGKDSHGAFVEAFSPNVRGFQDRFVEWAGSLEATEVATMMERQSVLGDLLGELTRKGKKFNDLTHFKRSAMAGGYRMHYSKGGLSWDSDPDVRVYFASIDGKALTTDQLFFSPRTAGPLPDIVCRCLSYTLRTRFYAVGDKYEHEIFLEPPSNRPQVGAN